MRMLRIALGMVAQRAASGTRVFEILDREPGLVSPRRAGSPAGGGRGAAQRELRLRRGEPILSDVDLTVEPGRTVALVGPTGSERPRS